MRTLFFLAALMIASGARSQIENYYLQNRTPEYKQVIRFYDSIAKKVPHFKFTAGDKTDVGYPVNLLVISKSKNFDAASLHKQNKAVLFINNGIHPGEPDGIDACINLVKELATDPNKIPDDVVICIVAVYNIDGALKRNSVMRMNQNGPEEFGFRGNAKNLDLNRDFVKCDAENTKSLLKLFHLWRPHFFIDTHVSNGADYQYTMTLIHPNAQKFAGASEVPATVTGQLVASLQSKGTDVCPYVESIAEIPDSGIYEFNQTPRYCTGFTSLFNCISMVTETHMLKAYPLRVKATLELLRSAIEVTGKNKNALIAWKRDLEKSVSTSDRFYFNWKNTELNPGKIKFKGFTAMHRQSNISGLQRLYYDRNRPWEREIPFYDKFIAGDTVKAPKYYVIPQAWQNVIEILKLNNVRMSRFRKDTVISAEVYYITDFKTSQRPYEGHYVHSSVKTRMEMQTLNFLKGDYLIPVNQPVNRYLVEVLEPGSDDSFFAWNFFDAVLQQKEWFSDYVFEEVAEKILQEDPSVKTKLDSAKAADKKLAESHWDQLNFIFQQSKYKEKSHNRYPVVRIN